MKSAYELAMERLEKTQPSVALSEDQKKQLADVDSTCRAKIAERELFLRDEIRKAQTAGNLEDVQKLEKQFIFEIARLREDCEAKKEKLRASFGK
jgi:tRNA uridine 5-carbamoylmethylation protein Kti12